MTIESDLRQPAGTEHDHGETYATYRRRVAEERALHWQRQGKLVGVGGSAAALIGVAIYCLSAIAARPGADLADIVLRGAIPVARAGLFLIACGVIAWLVGCVVHANAVGLAGARRPLTGPWAGGVARRLLRPCPYRKRGLPQT